MAPRPQDGEWGPQLVGNVGGEVAMLLLAIQECFLRPFEFGDVGGNGRRRTVRHALVVNEQPDAVLAA